MNKEDMITIGGDSSLCKRGLEEIEIALGCHYGSVTYYGFICDLDEYEYTFRFIDADKGENAPVCSIDEDISAYLLEVFFRPEYDPAINFEYIPGIKEFEHWGNNFYSREQLISILDKIEKFVDQIIFNPEAENVKKFFKEKVVWLMNSESIFYYLIFKLNDDEKYTFFVDHRDIVIRFYKKFLRYMRKFLKNYPQAEMFCVSGP